MLSQASLKVVASVLEALYAEANGPGDKFAVDRILRGHGSNYAQLVSALSVVTHAMGEKQDQ